MNFNYLSEVAYYRTLAKIVINKITKKEDLLTVKNFISCQNITYLENNDLHSIKFNNINMSDSKVYMFPDSDRGTDTALLALAN